MTGSFDYHMPTRVIFGVGSVERLGKVLDEVGADKVIIVTGRGSIKKAGLLDRVAGLLDGFEVRVFDRVEADPSVETVDDGAEDADGVDVVIGLGGGSALDAAKAISAVLGNGGQAAEYIRGRKAEKPGPPIVAIPTTAGTASEVTEVSVLSDRSLKIKKSFRSKHMYPAVALDDPELTKTMPKPVTASTGLDALAHAVEALTSKNSQPIPDVLCMEAAKLVLENLEKAYEDGDDIQARKNMMLGSLMAGFGITHAGAGLSHGLSYGLWRVADTPHGLACGFLLPHVMRFNLGHEGGKYAALARHCGYKSPEDLIGRVEALNEALEVPARLHGFGITERDVEAMVEIGMSGSTRVNPRPVDEKTMREFIRSIL